MIDSSDPPKSPSSEESAPAEIQLNAALLPDRLLAFLLDLSLLFAVYGACTWARHPAAWPLTVRPSPLSGSVAVGLFSLYLGAGSTGRMRSAGALLLGLSVARPDGSLPGLARGFLRGLALPLSAATVLGALWAWWDSMSRCAHDIISGTVVVETPGWPPLLRWVGRAAGCSAALFCLGAVWWTGAVLPGYYRRVNVAYAQVGLNEMAQLQRRFRVKHGRYAATLQELAAASPKPEEFLRDMQVLFDVKSGVIMYGGRNGFRIVATVKNEDRTTLAVTGR